MDMLCDNRKLKICLVAIVFFTSGLGQAFAKQIETEQIVIGEKVTIQSALLKEKRQIWVYKPPSYKYSESKYPVIYLLDGDNHFHHATGVVQFLARQSRMPEAIVIGLLNTARSRDFLPPTQVEADKQDTPLHGGADKFIQFFADELIPYVNNRYRAAEHRTLIGHSYGGIFTLHAFVTQPKLFHHYISISPSLWWNNKSMVTTKIKKLLTTNSNINASLFVTMGNEGEEILNSVKKLEQLLKTKAPSNLHWGIDLMDRETHGSTPHISIYKGLESLFSEWMLVNAFDSVEAGGYEFVEKHYRKLSQRYGYDIKMPENVANSIGYRYLSKGNTSDALEFFKLNVKNYPASANAYDSLGDGYRANKNYILAQKNYKKAIELATQFSDPRLNNFKANLNRLKTKVN